MSALALKVIAIIAMACDHLGWMISFQSPKLCLVLRIIGRIAMPIFCFFIAEGFRKTSNPLKYLGRLAIAALISEIPFNLCFSQGATLIDQGSLNVMFTLLLGLVGLILYEWIKENTGFIATAMIPPLLMGLLAQLLGCDYGFYGPLLILLFYIVGYESTHGKIYLCVTSLLFGARYVVEFAMKRLLAPLVSSFAKAELVEWDFLQFFAVIAAILLVLYNGKAGKRPNNRFVRLTIKYSFYLFYPIHLIILWLIFRLK